MYYHNPLQTHFAQKCQFLTLRGHNTKLAHARCDGFSCAPTQFLKLWGKTSGESSISDYNISFQFFAYVISGNYLYTDNMYVLLLLTEVDLRNKPIPLR